MKMRSILRELLRAFLPLGGSCDSTAKYCPYVPVIASGVERCRKKFQVTGPNTKKLRGSKVDVVIRGAEGFASENYIIRNKLSCPSTSTIGQFLVCFSSSLRCPRALCSLRRWMCHYSVSHYHKWVASRWADRNYLFRQRLCNCLTALLRYINFVLLLLLLLLLLWHG